MMYGIKIKPRWIDKQPYYSWSQISQEYNLHMKWLRKNRKHFNDKCVIVKVKREVFNVKCRNPEILALNWYALNRLLTILAWKEVMEYHGIRPRYARASIATDIINRKGYEIDEFVRWAKGQVIERDTDLLTLSHGKKVVVIKKRKYHRSDALPEKLIEAFQREIPEIYEKCSLSSMNELNGLVQFTISFEPDPVVNKAVGIARDMGILPQKGFVELEG